jgi:Sulfatase-modifying factor enzyme 1
MEGNAFEWVADWYNALYYRTSPAQDPLGPDTGQKRSVRSSSFASNSDQVSPAVRFLDDPTNHRRDLGFRCVVTDPTYFAPFCQQVVDFGTNGAGGGGQPPVAIPTSTCLPLGVTSVGACLSKVPSAIVTFSPHPAGSLINLTGACTPPTDPGTNVYTCTTAGTATITESCPIPPPPGSPSCAAGYTYDAGTNSCIPTAGSGGTCLPPFVYDPAKQCCSAIPGTTGSSYPLCPAGTYSDGAGDCLPWSTPSALTKTTSVDLGTCGGGPPPGTGTGTPGACTQTVTSCNNMCTPYGGKFNSNTCTCTCNPP